MKQYSKKSNGNVVLHFESNINIDNGFTNESLGNFKSEMELFLDENNVPCLIEWVVEDLDIVEDIGLVFDGNKLVEYDGVFELPKEAIELIEHSGFIVGEEFKELINDEI